MNGKQKIPFFRIIHRYLPKIIFIGSSIVNDACGFFPESKKKILVTMGTNFWEVRKYTLAGGCFKNSRVRQFVKLIIILQFSNVYE